MLIELAMPEAVFMQSNKDGICNRDALPNVTIKSIIANVLEIIYIDLENGGVYCIANRMIRFVY